MMKKIEKVVKFLVTLGLMAIGVAILFLAAWVIVAGIADVGRFIGSTLKLRPVTTMTADMPTEGIGRVPSATRYLSSTCAGEAETARVLETYTEWEGVAPDWYHPWEPMAVEWEDNSLSRSGGSSLGEGAVRDAGCPDWNVDSTLYGWGNHTAEAWEMDLFSRIFYLEFWGTSEACCEAGCDAMLNLWASGHYGETMADSLTYWDPEYGYTYSTYPAVWATEYDADGLAWCRAFCEGRFYAGPEWGAAYFQLGGYHDPDWVTPAYEIDGVYFSVGK